MDSSDRRGFMFSIALAAVQFLPAWEALALKDAEQK
jgi:hypothetical protein